MKWGEMLSGPMEPNSSIEPSAGPLATYAWARLPPAPGLFSTTTDWPMFSPSFLAITRAAMSADPPAAKPTTMVTGFLGGKSWAWAAVKARGNPATIAVTTVNARRFIVSP